MEFESVFKTNLMGPVLAMDVQLGASRVLDRDSLFRGQLQDA
jgi:hypothetical protein